MNPEQFRKSTSGQVVRVGQGEAAYWAFVPHPLPPSLPADWELTRALSEADRALSELAGLGRTIPNPHLLIGPFVRREAVLSSRIEGTQANIADLYAYEVGQLPLPGLEAPPEADVREVLNYVNALEYGLKRLETLPVSLRLMRELHERLLAGVRGEYATPGEFRRSQNWIGPPGCTLNEATFVPPPVPQMHEALDALEKYLHSDDVYPPLLRLALVHHQFEAIHPFVDGNGRIGRLLLSLLLVQWELLPLPLLYLSAYFYRHRQDYYDLLLGVSARGAWRDWLLFFLRGVAEQAGDAAARARRLQDLRETWHQRLAQTRSSALLIRLVDALFDRPILTIPQAQRLLDVTYPSAQRNVEKLVQAGILQLTGEAVYGKTYMATEIMNVIGEERTSG
ncbi:MAG TPA: Fic family protein [Anaerolineae bacterium]|nr:Fic family protein [Anaerolineae bacterium]HQK14948.1 Fic family protein [Anaerolineae bacterium]